MSDNQQSAPEVTPDATSDAETTVTVATEATAEEKEKEDKKGKEARRKTIVAILWILLIAGFAFLVLFLASRIGQFDSIADMFDFIKEQF